MLHLLPTEVIFRVLDQLDITETEAFIDTVSSLAHNQPPDVKNELEELVILAYQRIYRGKFIVYSNVDSGTSSKYNKRMTIGDFLDKFDEIPSIENTAFTTTRSKSVDFVFIRQATDYTNFVKDLNCFSDMVEGNTNDKLLRHLDTILQYGLYINGNCVAIESTTSFLVAILKVLISISSQTTSVHEKLTHITIKSTDIGQYFINQWCKLFGRFHNVTSLDLSDNLIKSDESLYDFSSLSNNSIDDVMGTIFEWPPNLTYLNLNQNFLTYVSHQFITKLPKTLEVLILSNNMITKLGEQVDPIDLNGELPNLHTLSISHNNRLIYVDPRVFRSSKNRLKRLKLNGCNLVHQNINDLANLGSQMGFILQI